MARQYPNLNPDKALIWRIVHRENLPWILDNGLHCGNSCTKAPTWVNIGNEELITKRSTRPVPITPGGYLSDYVPFYFTPFSPMLYNITTGRGGVQKRSNEEIIIFVSSLHHLADLGIPFLFTDSHAYPILTIFYSDLGELDHIDWNLLQSRDFKRDPEDPEKFDRYQAEALIYKHLPIHGLLGVICFNEKVQSTIEEEIGAHGAVLPVYARPKWYFT
ncbi:MAG: DUF4433 domain-containing protein [Zavarzinella sp.]